MINILKNKNERTKSGKVVMDFFSFIIRLQQRISLINYTRNSNIAYLLIWINKISLNEFNKWNLYIMNWILYDGFLTWLPFYIFANWISLLISALKVKLIFIFIVYVLIEFHLGVWSWLKKKRGNWPREWNFKIIFITFFSSQYIL